VYDAAARLVAPEAVAEFAAWLETLPAGELEFVSPDFTPFQGALAGTRWEQVPVRTAPRGLAAAIARLAARAEPQDPAALDANYVRRSDAELLWKE
jgi:tRNA threonylcarbamoyladenosine biosynthesis protein TsaB